MRYLRSEGVSGGFRKFQNFFNRLQRRYGDVLGVSEGRGCDTCSTKGHFRKFQSMFQKRYKVFSGVSDGHMWFKWSTGRI